MRINNINNYCKRHNLKFERLTNEGFIASSKSPVFAGMEYNLYNCKIISIPLRKIGTKKVFTLFTCFDDGDIVDSGRIENFS